jgi:hypothetical protein
MIAYIALLTTLCNLPLIGYQFKVEGYIVDYGSGTWTFQPQDFTTDWKLNYGLKSDSIIVKISIH